MGLYDNIKKYAAKKHISILQLERDCNIPKGSMSRFNVNTPSSGRLAIIAEHLGVTVDNLMKGDEVVEHKLEAITKEDVQKIVSEAMNKQYYIDPDAAAVAQELKDNPEMKVLFDACRKVKPEHMKTVIKMIQSLSED